MKKFAVVQFGILAGISWIAAVLTFFAGRRMGYRWHELLDGREMVPRLMNLSLDYGYLVPAACGVAAVVCMAGVMKRGGAGPVWWHLFTLITTVELMGLSFIAWICTHPVLRIMYRIM